MLDNLFGFLDLVEPVEKDLFSFGGLVSLLFDSYKSWAEMPVDIRIGLTLIGERGREKFFERMRLMRIQYHME